MEGDDSSTTAAALESFCASADWRACLRNAEVAKLVAEIRRVLAAAAEESSQNSSALVLESAPSGVPVGVLPSPVLAEACCSARSQRVASEALEVQAQEEVHVQASPQEQMQELEQEQARATRVQNCEQISDQVQTAPEQEKATPAAAPSNAASPKAATPRAASPKAATPRAASPKAQMQPEAAASTATFELVHTPNRRVRSGQSGEASYAIAAGASTGSVPDDGSTSESKQLSSFASSSSSSSSSSRITLPKPPGSCKTVTMAVGEDYDAPRRKKRALTEKRVENRSRGRSSDGKIAARQHTHHTAGPGKHTVHKGNHSSQSRSRSRSRSKSRSRSRSYSPHSRREHHRQGYHDASTQTDDHATMEKPLQLQQKAGAAGEVTPPPRQQPSRRMARRQSKRVVIAANPQRGGGAGVVPRTQSTVLPRGAKLMLSVIRMHTAPNFDVSGGCDPYVTVKCNSIEVYRSYPKMYKEWKGKNFVDIDCGDTKLQGHVVVDFWDYDAVMPRDDWMCNVSFDIADMHQSYMILYKSEINGAKKDTTNSRFHPGFTLEFCFNKTHPRLLPQPAQAFQM
eukprot:TRINITY_DN3337_c0_g1_i3.p1 TRINITY_DN3337_c0_g1~~TRINITY_DN3337_c0_g1_i3.p1  ORF type:complete len:571 (-),score=93.38 TRINITY_DN3337_c0_g1_i3:23-1735(-)